MSMYYLKKLGEQELGYRAGTPGGGGRYFYISKYCLGFFPALSQALFNDSVLLPIVPLFLGNRAYAKFVYHNDRHTRPGGTRDEYRIYLNMSIDPGGAYYNPGDIIVFEKEENTIDGSVIPEYFLSKYESGDDKYNSLNDIIQESRSRGDHALFEGDLNIENPENVENQVAVIDDEIRRDVAQVIGEDEQLMGANFFNSISFRDFVLNSYGFKCAISGESIKWNNLINLESAHIRPRAHGGTFLPCNGIALSRDMHWAFDKGLIYIDDEYKVFVHDEVRDTMLGRFHGQVITLPSENFFRPKIDYLHYHKENIYGLFKHTGSIRRLA